MGSKKIIRDRGEQQGTSDLIRKTEKIGDTNQGSGREINTKERERMVKQK